MSRETRRSSDTPYLVCDVCGKSQNITEREARAYGWTIEPGIGDYCTDCGESL